jgi:transposase
MEETAWLATPEERLKIRQTEETVLIDELIDKIKAKLHDGKVLPKSKLREALGYFCGLIPYLKNYTQYPNARIDNNVAERALRPLAIGRKNWLFFGSREGGDAAAVLLSLVQTCRGLQIDSREYLEDLFRKFMGHPANRLEELLPDRWFLGRQNSP